MSHFSVGVLTKEYPSNDVLTRILQPWHEFECTGTADQYVVTVDQTEEKRKEYEDTTISYYTNQYGERLSKYDERFYRDPTPDEAKHIGPFGGTGWGNGISYTSKDWGDGQGYRSKVHYIPEDWSLSEVPAPQAMSFLAWLKYWDSNSNFVIYPDLPDLEETHKYGWVTLDQQGDVLGVYRRTNPNKKWDWWTVGGRYSNRLYTLDHHTVDIAQLCDINWGAMQLQRKQWRIENWREANNRPDMAKFIYDIDLETMDHDTYINTDTGFQLFAYVLDGQWVEKGEMGWWAMVANEQGQEWYDNLNHMLANLDSRMYLTIVDCHI